MADRTSRAISPLAKVAFFDYLDGRLANNRPDTFDELRTEFSDDPALLARIDEHDYRKQPADLLPTKTANGILFQCRAPHARSVYLAADFNGWANNKDGYITDQHFAMEGPDAKGIWHKAVKLAPGTYRFRFNVDGNVRTWFTPDTIHNRDNDENAVFTVRADGSVDVK